MAEESYKGSCQKSRVRKGLRKRSFFLDWVRLDGGKRRRLLKHLLPFRINFRSQVGGKIGTCMR